MGLFLHTYFEEIPSVKETISDMESFLRAAHDLRSPLSALNLTMDHFKRTIPGIDHLDLLDETVRRINQIAEDILQAKRAATVSENSFSLEDSIISVFRQASLQIPNNVQIKFLSSENLSAIPVQGSISHFQRILWNLVQNSVEANARELLFSLSEIEGGFKLVIADNGDGIPKEIMSRIGQEGFTTKANGNGLGLFSAIQQIKSWNGILSVMNHGKGTRIEIELPYSSTSGRSPGSKS
jgi:signal transduction histidine kinase